MQQAKSKLVLEHLVVQGASKKNQLKQQDLDELIKYGAAELFARKEAPPTPAPGQNLTTFSHIQSRSHASDSVCAFTLWYLGVSSCRGDPVSS